MAKNKDYTHLEGSSERVCRYIDRYLEWLDKQPIAVLMSEWDRVRKEIRGEQKKEVRKEWLTR